jgi:Pyruvate/2-oxoacid:ferredoxin oxidoreductase delta subunit
MAGILENRPRPLSPALIRSRCHDDRACELSCPEAAIDILDLTPTKRRWTLNVRTCTGCGICIAACPERALAAVPLTSRFPAPYAIELTASEPL